MEIDGAWRTYLRALGVDADAAIAASLTYAELDATGREAFLEALTDAPTDVPAVALFAPLLFVEDDVDRRARIERKLAASMDPAAIGERRAYRGEHPTGDHVALLVAPIYLSFVDALACRYHPDRGVLSATWTAFVRESDLQTRSAFDAMLDPAPFLEIVDDIAHAVLADQRAGRASPPDLAPFTKFLR